MNDTTDTGHPGQPGQPGPAGPPGQPGPDSHGPRVTRDEVRDLAALRRSRDDRKVAGVAAGIARHLDIDPLLVRIGFVILTFFGGSGLILYGVCWLFVPEEHTEDTVIRVDSSVRTAILIVGGIVAIASVVGDTVGGPDFPWPLLLIGGILIVVFAGKNAIKPGGPPHPWMQQQGGAPNAPQPPAPPAAPTGPAAPPWQQTGWQQTGWQQPDWQQPDWQPPNPPQPYVWRPEPRRRGPLLFPLGFALSLLGIGILATVQLAGVDVVPSAYPATVLGICGVLLLVGAFYGRAGGLIFIGLIAAVSTAAFSTVDHLDLSAGSTRPYLQQASDLEGSYNLGVGEIVIDLRDIRDLQALDGRAVHLELGVGHIEVIVPKEGLNVVARSTIDVGDVRMFGRNSSDDLRANNGYVDGAPTLSIEADLDLGQIEFRSAA